MQQYNVIIPKGHPNRPGTKLESVKAIVVHYTQNEFPTMTDTANARWVSRNYVKKNNAIYETDGKTPFRYGSAHVFCDMDSVTITIPTDEAAWGVGDRNFYGGFKPAAHTIFKARQNYNTISAEICNNDAIKNSNEDWESAVSNAKTWISSYLIKTNRGIDIAGSLAPQQAISISPGKVLLLRHYDITGKICPKPFVDDKTAWENFIKDIARKVNLEVA